MLLITQVGFAQAIYGSLYGTVQDTTGAVVPNAKVTVKDVTKGTTTTTQSNGEGLRRLITSIPRVLISFRLNPDPSRLDTRKV